MEAGASAKKAHEQNMNKLYYGDNLDVLRRYVKDESVDLVYLDPPLRAIKIMLLSGCNLRRAQSRDSTLRG